MKKRETAFYQLNWFRTALAGGSMYVNSAKQDVSCKKIPNGIASLELNR